MDAQLVTVTARADDEKTMLIFDTAGDFGEYAIVASFGALKTLKEMIAQFDSGNPRVGIKMPEGWQATFLLAEGNIYMEYTDASTVKLYVFTAEPLLQSLRDMPL